jgi:hypothetical protein
MMYNKRLGLSVRQGQRLKDELVAKGVIEEHQETTRTGRLSRVSLTTQGSIPSRASVDTYHLCGRIS